LWWQGWQDAHAAILPPDLARVRTLESFHERLENNLANLRVAEIEGRPVGLAIIDSSELYQFYVAQEARGTDVAGALMSDCLSTFREADIQLAWLHCAIGNRRAARFYEKWGWRNAGAVETKITAGAVNFTFEVWRFEQNVSERHK
jgi:GNAT superfamily N-acetyltransferase